MHYALSFTNIQFAPHVAKGHREEVGEKAPVFWGEVVLWVG